MSIGQRELLLLNELALCVGTISSYSGQRRTPGRSSFNPRSLDFKVAFFRVFRDQKSK